MQSPQLNNRPQIHSAPPIATSVPPHPGENTAVQNRSDRLTSSKSNLSVLEYMDSKQMQHEEKLERRHYSRDVTMSMSAISSTERASATKDAFTSSSYFRADTDVDLHAPQHTLSSGDGHMDIPISTPPIRLGGNDMRVATPYSSSRTIFQSRGSSISRYTEDQHKRGETRFETPKATLPASAIIAKNGSKVFLPSSSSSAASRSTIHQTFSSSSRQLVRWNLKPSQKVSSPLTRDYHVIVSSQESDRRVSRVVPQHNGTDQRVIHAADSNKKNQNTHTFNMNAHEGWGHNESKDKNLLNTSSSIIFPEEEEAMVATPSRDFISRRQYNQQQEKYQQHRRYQEQQQNQQHQILSSQYAGDGGDVRSSIALAQIWTVEGEFKKATAASNFHDLSSGQVRHNVAVTLQKRSRSNRDLRDVGEDTRPVQLESTHLGDEKEYVQTQKQTQTQDHEHERKLMKSTKKGEPESSTPGSMSESVEEDELEESLDSFLDDVASVIDIENYLKKENIRYDNSVGGTFSGDSSTRSESLRSSAGFNNHFDRSAMSFNPLL